MTSLQLPDIPDAEWVPIWPAIPLRMRVVDPQTMQTFAVPAAECWARSEMMMRDTTVTASVDQNIDRLAAVLRDWARQGLVNEVNSSGLTFAALQGAAVAATSLECRPWRPGFVHPAVHVALAMAEDVVLGDSGPAGVVALNAAFTGVSENTPWHAMAARPPA